MTSLNSIQIRKSRINSAVYAGLIQSLSMGWDEASS